MDFKKLWQNVVRSVRRFGRKTSRERELSARKTSQTARARQKRSARRERLGLPPSTLGMGIGEINAAIPSRRPEAADRETRSAENDPSLQGRRTEPPGFGGGQSERQPSQDSLKDAGNETDQPADGDQAETPVEAEGDAGENAAPPKASPEPEDGGPPQAATPGPAESHQADRAARDAARIAQAQGRRIARRRRLGLPIGSGSTKRTDTQERAEPQRREQAAGTGDQEEPDLKIEPQEQQSAPDRQVRQGRGKEETPNPVQPDWDEQPQERQAPDRQDRQRQGQEQPKGQSGPDLEIETHERQPSPDRQSPRPRQQDEDGGLGGPDLEIEPQDRQPSPAHQSPRSHGEKEGEGRTDQTDEPDLEIEPQERQSSSNRPSHKQRQRDEEEEGEDTRQIDRIDREGRRGGGEGDLAAGGGNARGDEGRSLELLRELVQTANSLLEAVNQGNEHLAELAEKIDNVGGARE